MPLSYTALYRLPLSLDRSCQKVSSQPGPGELRGTLWLFSLNSNSGVTHLKQLFVKVKLLLLQKLHQIK